jgi:Ion channel
MLIRLLQSALLLGVTVTFHTLVLSLLLRHAERYVEEMRLTFVRYTWLLVRIAAVTVLAHLIEIALWAAFYVWKDAMPDFVVSLYFSAVTYATIGYGDVVPPEPWRLAAAVEGLTGILMCGWSAAFFFAIVSRSYSRIRSSKGQAGSNPG